jgi:hypothetical protein
MNCLVNLGRIMAYCNSSDWSDRNRHTGTPATKTGRDMASFLVFSRVIVCKQMIAFTCLCSYAYMNINFILNHMYPHVNEWLLINIGTSFLVTKYFVPINFLGMPLEACIPVACLHWYRPCGFKNNCSTSKEINLTVLWLIIGCHSLL